jgi:hypothetical protein
MLLRLVCRTVDDEIATEFHSFFIAGEALMFGFSLKTVWIPSCL